MIVEFCATGHRHITAMHPTTLEFTKSGRLRLEGDCIIAVNSDFDAEKLKLLVTACDKIKVIITVDGISEVVEATVNKRFCSDEEIVLRMGVFDSVRTLGVRANKGAVHLNRDLVEKLKNPDQVVKVRIEGMK